MHTLIEKVTNVVRIISAFCFKIYLGMSVLWVALHVLSLFISLKYYQH